MLLTAIRVLLAVALYTVAALVIGLALVPGVFLCLGVWNAAVGFLLWQRITVVCLSVAVGYFLFGFSILLLAALVRWVFRLDLREGIYPLASLGMLKWYISGALQHLVWTVFGDFLLLTPFAALFYRLMGAKLGLNVQINSKYGADASLVEIGDSVVIGGHATVIAHSFEPSGLVLRKVRIGRNAVIGLNSVVLPGVEVGEGAVVGAGVVVPKDTKIPAGTTYLGPDRKR